MLLTRSYDGCRPRAGGAPVTNVTFVDHVSGAGTASPGQMSYSVDHCPAWLTHDVTSRREAGAQTYRIGFKKSWAYSPGPNDYLGFSMKTSSPTPPRDYVNLLGVYGIHMNTPYDTFPSASASRREPRRRINGFRQPRGLGVRVTPIVTKSLCRRAAARRSTCPTCARLNCGFSTRFHIPRSRCSG